ncbi:MAG: DUF4126 domain-containing protein [Betaproteobacteria bacterium]|nr:DUF4126 domain-containing protein [Betaproteobacteria bacterium]
MDSPFAALVLAAALAWASGIRLYATLFLIGVAGYFHLGGWTLPPALAVLAHPWVIVATAILLLLEFFADKIPAIDSIWDLLHTFVRIPAGALLAAGVIGADDGAAWTVVAGLLGGTITAGTHFFKTGSRLAINASPEPVSNWTASFAEEIVLLSGLWLAFRHPLVFLLLLILFGALVVWMLPKLWRLIANLAKRVAAWNRGADPRLTGAR